MNKKKIRIRLPDHVHAAEQQHAQLLDKFTRLQTDICKARAKYELLSACLELLRWLYAKQEQEDACSHVVPADELLQLEQMLLQLAPQSSSQTDAGPPQEAAAPDAWRTCPLAPCHDPLALLREVFQLPPHPGARPDITLQELQHRYSKVCGELALHMRVQANPYTSAEDAAASAARARAVLFTWHSLVAALLSSPQAGLMAQLFATDCSTGEGVSSDLHNQLQEAALGRIELSPEQQERIALAYEVLAELQSASLEEAMALRCSLGEPAAQLFGAASLPVGLVQPAADVADPDAALSGSSVVRERHQADLQRLRVKLNKALFWEHCLISSFVGALTINQACELGLSVFPCHVRLTSMAKKVAAMHRENRAQQEQQAAAARQQAQGKKGRRRQQSDNGNNTASKGAGTAACGSAC